MTLKTDEELTTDELKKRIRYYEEKLIQEIEEWCDNKYNKWSNRYVKPEETMSRLVEVRTLLNHRQEHGNPNDPKDPNDDWEW